MLMSANMWNMSSRKFISSVCIHIWDTAFFFKGVIMLPYAWTAYSDVHQIQSQINSWIRKQVVSVNTEEMDALASWARGNIPPPNKSIIHTLSCVWLLRGLTEQIVFLLSWDLSQSGVFVFRKSYWMCKHFVNLLLTYPCCTGFKCPWYSVHCGMNKGHILS